MNYHLLREFADSWALLVMLLLYVALVGWAFRRGSKRANRRAKMSIFEGDDQDG